MRKRRNNGVWLPPDPYNAVGFDDTIPISATDQSIIKQGTAPLGGTLADSGVVDIPLVGDFNQDRVVGETLATGPTLADARFGYSLKRVVGKIWVHAPNFDPGLADAAYLWCVTAGLIVRRTDDVGDPLTIQTNPQLYDAAGDPWIWRRSWIVCNQVQALLAQSTTPAYPQNNVAGLPSALDGPHIDAKTRRTIKQEERLYLHIGTVALNGTAQDQFVLRWVADLRFFGRIFQSAGNRRNATR